MENRVDENLTAPGGPAPAQPDFQTTLPPAAPPAPQQPNKRRRWLFLAIVLALILAAGAALLISKSSKKPTVSQKSLTKISVRLEWINNPQFTGMYIAQDKGFYKAAGLDVNLKEFEDNVDISKEVASGVVDYGVSTPLEVILARDKGEKNKAVAAVYQTSAYSIAAQKSANINTPADFKGKILGNSGDNAEAKVTYAALLANAGINSRDVTIKPVGFDITEVFKNNEASTFDIYRTDQTYLLDQAHIPYTQIFPEQFGFNIYGDVLIASDNTIAQKPAQTKAFVQATMKGWQYAIDHPDEALTINDKHANKLYKDLAYEKFDLTRTLSLIKPTGNEPLGDMQYVPWNRAVEGIKLANLLSGNVEVNDIYTSQFVQ